MKWRWPFRRRLPPLKSETRARDQRIIDLDHELAIAHRAQRLHQRRIDRMILDLGEQFAAATRQMADRVVGPNGRRNGT
jgi:hypothetical protein